MKKVILTTAALSIGALAMASSYDAGLDYTLNEQSNKGATELKLSGSTMFDGVEGLTVNSELTFSQITAGKDAADADMEPFGEENDEASTTSFTGYADFSYDVNPEVNVYGRVGFEKGDADYDATAGTWTSDQRTVNYEFVGASYAMDNGLSFDGFLAGNNFNQDEELDPGAYMNLADKVGVFYDSVNEGPVRTQMQVGVGAGYNSDQMMATAPFYTNAGLVYGATAEDAIVEGQKASTNIGYSVDGGYIVNDMVTVYGGYDGYVATIDGDDIFKDSKSNGGESIISVGVKGTY